MAGRPPPASSRDIPRVAVCLRVEDQPPFLTHHEDPLKRGLRCARQPPGFDLTILDDGVVRTQNSTVRSLGLTHRVLEDAQAPGAG